jgi:hypothetical protein
MGKTPYWMMTPYKSAAKMNPRLTTTVSSLGVHLHRPEYATIFEILLYFSEESLL